MGGYIIEGVIIFVLLIVIGFLGDSRVMLNRKILLLENGYTNVTVENNLHKGEFKAKFNGNEVTGVVVDDRIFLSK